MANIEFKDLTKHFEGILPCGLFAKYDTYHFEADVDGWKFIIFQCGRTFENSRFQMFSVKAFEPGTNKKITISTRCRLEDAKAKVAKFIENGFKK